MSLKKAKDYLGNDLQVDSALKDGKGQVIHKTYINKTIPDGTITKNIGVDSNGDIVKETPSGGGGISGGYTLSITQGSLNPYRTILVLGTYDNIFGLHKLNTSDELSLTNVIFFEILDVGAITPYTEFTTPIYDANGTLHTGHENSNFTNKLFVLKENTSIEIGDDD